MKSKRKVSPSESVPDQEVPVKFEGVPPRELPEFPLDPSETSSLFALSSLEAELLELRFEVEEFRLELSLREALPLELFAPLPFSLRLFDVF